MNFFLFKHERAEIVLCLGPPKYWILFELQNKKKIWKDLFFLNHFCHFSKKTI
jgi:hypothetical protein